MNLHYTRPAALLTGAIFITIASLSAGCSNDKQASGDAPYGQAATTTPDSPAAAPSAPPAADAGQLAGGATAPPAGAVDANGGATGIVPAPPLNGAGVAPMLDNPTAPLTPSPILDKAIADAKAKGDKKAIGQAYADRGFERMTDDAAGAKVKYRSALDDFRTALKFDPTNAKAKENKDLIEKIYREMGRPIPGE